MSTPSVQTPAKDAGRPSNRRYAAAVALMIVATLTGWAIEPHLMVTSSPSLKYRLYYRSETVPKTVHNGDYISFQRTDSLINGGRKFAATKRAVCVEGENLRVSGFDYYCGDKYLGTGRDHLRDGRKLQHFVFNGPIPKGKFFAFGDHPDSYDSRYWGFLGTEEATERVTPLI